MRHMMFVTGGNRTQEISCEGDIQSLAELAVSGKRRGEKGSSREHEVGTEL